MAVTVTGSAICDKEKDGVVDIAVELMCDWAVSTATTQENTQNCVHLNLQMNKLLKRLFTHVKTHQSTVVLKEYLM